MEEYRELTTFHGDSTTDTFSRHFKFQYIFIMSSRRNKKPSELDIGFFIFNVDVRRTESSLSVERVPNITNPLKLSKM